MTIRASLYDFFAYTIPGVFYLAIGIYGLAIFGLLSVDAQKIADISLIAAVFVIGAGYVTGMIMDFFAELWHRLFNPKGRRQPALESLLASNPDFQPTFQANDWPIVLAHLRGLDSDQATEIDRFNAYGIMLRNISLGLFVLALVNVAYYLVVDSLVTSLVLSGVLVLLSVIAGVKGAEFRLWYYRAIFFSVVGTGLKANDFFTRNKPGHQANSPDGESDISATEIVES